ncbi:MAG: hypothetical protein J2P20_18670, partial [Pseudonocardia sp.]|nr:hypothetical protein [Pseudonocardia sp.]
MRPARRGRADYACPAGSAVVPAGVSLARLARVARLTPQQALVIAAEVLGRVAERHAEGSVVDGLDEHRVWVGHDGRVRLVDPPLRAAAGRDPGAVDADVASCRRLLANLGRAIGDRAAPSRASGASERAAARLLMSVPDLDGGIAASALTVRVASAPGTRQATAELAALVSALVGDPTAALSGTRPHDRAPDEPPPADPVERDGGRTAWGWRALAELVGVAVARWGRWCIAAVVLLGLLGLELVVFGDRIESDLATLRAAGHVAERPATVGGAAPAPVAEPAPPANGLVTG